MPLQMITFLCRRGRLALLPGPWATAECPGNEGVMVIGHDDDELSDDVLRYAAAERGQQQARPAEVIQSERQHQCNLVT
jgi:hypothetical protein